MTTDDDIREVLRARADEATVSPDAWDRIASRLDEGRAPRRLPRRLAAVATAAAVVAATVIVVRWPEPASRVATSPSTTTRAPAPAVDAAGPPEAWSRGPATDADAVATDYVSYRTGVQTSGAYERIDADHGVARFTGPVATEVWLRRSAGRWAVVSASSDLVPIHDPVYEQTILSADVVPEVAGTLWLGTDPFGPDDAPMPVTARQSVPVRLAGNGAHLRAVLRTSDGRFGVSEVSLTDHNLPASPTGEIVSVWPAVDQGALDLLQQDADEGRRPDLLEPVSVAAAYLSALLPRDSSATPFPFHVGNFRQGDPTSGEVPFDLDGVEAGSILVRRDGEGGIWHVDTVASTGLTFAGVELVGEGTFSVRIVPHLTADRANWQTHPGGSDISEGVQLGLMAPGDTAEIRVATAGRPHWVQVVLRSNDRIVAIGVERLP